MAGMDQGSNRYADIIDRERPRHHADDFSRRHPPMPLEERAKIFLPFAALKGYEQKVEEKEIIVPVFALGRAQELMYTLKQWQRDNSLNTTVPIYFDGNLGIKYTSLFLRDGLDNKEEAKDKMKNFIDKL